jgi:hypothetical protein
MRILKNPEDYAYSHLQAVLMVTLRLYSPAISTTRSLEKELVMDGIPVPNGTYIPLYSYLDDSARLQKLSRAARVSTRAMGRSSSITLRCRKQKVGRLSLDHEE